MASRYWIEGVSGNWNDTANWSASTGGVGGVSVPGASDDVTFDGNGVGDCVCDIPLNANSITVTSGYSGKLDFADSSFHHTVANNMVFDGVGEIDLGNSTITCSGDFDNEDQTTWTIGTSTFVMDGASNTLTPKASTLSVSVFNVLRIEGTRIVSSALVVQDLIVTSGAAFVVDSVSAISICRVENDFQLDGTLESDLEFRLWPCTYAISSTAAVLGTGELVILLATGTIHASASLDILVSCNESAVTAIGGQVVFQKRVDIEVVSSGTVTLTGDFLFQGDFDFDLGFGETLIFDNSNNPNLEFQGNVDWKNGLIAWIKGTGTLIFSGSADQTVNFSGISASVEDWNIDKPVGTVLLLTDINSDSLTINSGILDTDSHNVSLVGDFIQAAGTTVKETASGSLITVGGDFSINGVFGNECVWDGPDLNVSGAASADWVTVTNSDASAGTMINAAEFSTDNGGNSNWFFSSRTVDVVLSEHNPQPFLDDLTARRGYFSGGAPLSSSVVELHGGNLVEMTAFEPDPVTFRGTHYYNTERNVLYKKVMHQVGEHQVATWTKVSV